MSEFTDKVVVITGAGGGLGKEHSLEFAKRGANDQYQMKSFRRFLSVPSESYAAIEQNGIRQTGNPDE